MLHDDDSGTPNSDVIERDAPLVGSATERVLAELASSTASLRETIRRDVERVEEMRAADFTGARYEEFADDACVYAVKFLNARLKTGEIVLVCAAGNVPVPFTEEDLATFARSKADREDLAYMTVAEAFRRFTEHALRRGEWDPRRGAALNTYFVGLCVRMLRDVYRTWQGKHRSRVAEHDRVLDPDDVALALTPAGAAVDERTLDLADAVLALAEHEKGMHTRVMVLMTVEGYTQDEIADRLGLTRKQVEGRLRRFRERARAARDSGLLADGRYRARARETRETRRRVLLTDESTGPR